MALQEEQDRKEGRTRELEDTLDRKTAQLIHLQRVAIERESSIAGADADPVHAAASASAAAAAAAVSDAATSSATAAAPAFGARETMTEGVAAAFGGHLVLLQWARANGARWDE